MSRLLFAMNNLLLARTGNSDDDAIAFAVLTIFILVFIVIAIIFAAVREGGDKEESAEINNQPPVTPIVSKETETIIEKRELSDADIENLKKYKKLVDEGLITQEEYDKFKNQTLGVVIKEKSGMKCPHCGGYHCSIINEIGTKGKDYEASKGCCGFLLLGPIGLLCGACGENKEIENTNYWVCNDCGHKWQV
jgi:DNA-directed RNA polymerase subunit RPC12/RpoP